MAEQSATWYPMPRAQGASSLVLSCGRAKGRLLIVEEDRYIADLFVTVLEEEGYAVERAGTPLDALDRLSRHRTGTGAYDLVLSAPFADPLAAPYAWLDNLRIAAVAPVVICARCPGVFYVDYRDRGYAAFLEEPFDLETLIGLVSALCSRPSVADEWERN